jgi:hypothetical protein
MVDRLAHWFDDDISSWRHLHAAVARRRLICATEEKNHGSLSHYRRMVNSRKRLVTATYPKVAKVDFCQFGLEVAFRGDT